MCLTGITSYGLANDVPWYLQDSSRTLRRQVCPRSASTGSSGGACPPLAERMALRLRLDEHRYWKIPEARHAVETRIAALAAQRRQAADLEALREALQGMDAAMDDPLTYIAIDERFHLALAAAAGNE